MSHKNDALGIVCGLWPDMCGSIPIRQGHLMCSVIYSAWPVMRGCVSLSNRYIVCMFYTNLVATLQLLFAWSEDVHIYIILSIILSCFFTFYSDLRHFTEFTIINQYR